MAALADAGVCAATGGHLLDRLLAGGLRLSLLLGLLLSCRLDRKLHFHRALVNFSHVVLLDGAVRRRSPAVDHGGCAQVRPEFISVEGGVDQRPTLAKQLLQICLGDHSRVDAAHTQLPFSKCALHNAQCSRKLLLLCILLILRHFLFRLGHGRGRTLWHAFTQRWLLVDSGTWQILVAGLGSSASRSLVLPQVLQSLPALLATLSALVLHLLILHGLVAHQAAALVLTLAF